MLRFKFAIILFSLGDFLSSGSDAPEELLAKRQLGMKIRDIDNLSNVVEIGSVEESRHKLRYVGKSAYKK